MSRFGVVAYNGDWPYRGPDETHRCDVRMVETLADALERFAAHAKEAAVDGGHVALSIDGFEVLAFKEGALQVAVELAIVPGPHAFEPADPADPRFATCKYCGRQTFIDQPEWWLPGETCPKKPIQEYWQQRPLVGDVTAVPA